MSFTQDRDTVSSKVVHYTDIFEKTAQNKGSQCLCAQDMQKHKSPNRELSPHITDLCTVSHRFYRLFLGKV